MISLGIYRNNFLGKYIDRAKYFECFKCQLISPKNYFLECQHCICQSCIKNEKYCSFCQDKEIIINGENPTAFQYRLTEIIINPFLLKCIFDPCEWTGTYQNFIDNHHNSCECREGRTLFNEYTTKFYEEVPQKINRKSKSEIKIPKKNKMNKLFFNDNIYSNKKYNYDDDDSYIDKDKYTYNGLNYIEKEKDKYNDDFFSENENFYNKNIIKRKHSYNSKLNNKYEEIIHLSDDSEDNNKNNSNSEKDEEEEEGENNREEEDDEENYEGKIEIFDNKENEVEEEDKLIIDINKKEVEAIENGEKEKYYKSKEKELENNDSSDDKIEEVENVDNCNLDEEEEEYEENEEIIRKKEKKWEKNGNYNFNFLNRKKKDYKIIDDYKNEGYSIYYNDYFDDFENIRENIYKKRK